MQGTTVKSKTERRKSWCPSCLDIRGNAVVFEAQGEGDAITYACPHCHQQWQRAHPSQKRQLLLGRRRP